MASALDSGLVDSNWMEFCERHAQAAAQDFSKSCMQYMNLSSSDSVSSTITHKELLRKFIESFTEQFEMDFNKRRLHNTKISNGLNQRTDEEMFENDDGSPKLQHKPFFRRYNIFNLFCPSIVYN